MVCSRFQLLLLKRLYFGYGLYVLWSYQLQCLPNQFVVPSACQTKPSPTLTMRTPTMIPKIAPKINKRLPPKSLAETSIKLKAFVAFIISISLTSDKRNMTQNPLNPLETKDSDFHTEHKRNDSSECSDRQDWSPYTGISS